MHTDGNSMIEKSYSKHKKCIHNTEINLTMSVKVDKPNLKNFKKGKTKTTLLSNWTKFEFKKTLLLTSKSST